MGKLNRQKGEEGKKGKRLLSGAEGRTKSGEGKEAEQCGRESSPLGKREKERLRIFIQKKQTYTPAEEISASWAGGLIIGVRSEGGNSGH